MGYCLTRHGVSHQFNVRAWDEILQLAESGGWKPAGTLAPLTWDSALNGGWSGDYGSNNWQIVTGDDARKMAVALDRALPSLVGKTSERWQEMVRAFIEFCSEGGFEIA